jgi:5-methylcytosine-specific restriction enzyme A
VKTFLLTWNPRVHAWDELPADLRKLKRGKLVVRWGCGRSRQIRDGDRLYLLRQGVEPRGLVGSGHASGDWYEGESFRHKGVPGHYVDIAVDALSATPFLPREALSLGKLADMYWNTMVSGVEIPQAVALELDRVWRGLTAA